VTQGQFAEFRGRTRLAFRQQEPPVTPRKQVYEQVGQSWAVCICFGIIIEEMQLGLSDRLDALTIESSRPKDWRL